ncbi:MAG: glycosyltransferase family 9 protein [Terrimicrobiaceae bacterium]|jgi:heptosyltransferase-2|nr:glycosyltransferase family 9 protein [Terrimicrobiaceae bacterium]
MPETRRSILVIRGGAIGDFLLTLPALRLLREGFPDCRIEIVGYRHICSVAEGRYYADAVRSIEYAPMSGFFNPRPALDPELSGYFEGFGQVISYLFDPDGFFEGNLRRCGVKNLICGDPRISGSQHAVRQLARPLESLALFLEDASAEIFPTDEDAAAAERLLAGFRPPFVAVHPGSGSAKKNWPLPAWKDLLSGLCGAQATILVVSGESDTDRVAELKAAFGARFVFLGHLPLHLLGAVLQRCAFYIGHDSGISHLAAAAGAECLLLFGPTDPAVWAPANPDVNVLRAPAGLLQNLSVEVVRARLPDFLQ